MNEPKKRGRLAKVAACDEKALAYAIRVWSGQSVDVPVKERIARVHRALEGQNLPTDGIDAETIQANL